MIPMLSTRAEAEARRIASDGSADPLGLYLHIPFCHAICHYCHFNRGLFDEARKRAYLDALVCEIARAGDGAAVDTIYFGGGTPSVLEPVEVARLLGACREAFGVAPDTEVSLELNPESADPGRLTGYRHAGVTRISMGVQSFRDAELQRLGRVHTAQRACEAYALIRAAGFSNVSLDLMFWLPEQTVADWLTSVHGAVALGPDHLSMYGLELYPSAPLRDTIARQGWSQVPDADAAAMYLDGLAALDAAGYAQYEISNVARAGRACRHNLKYWTDGEWLGFGCGAHSTRAGRRWWNLADTDRYIETVGRGGVPVAGRRVLTCEERVGDALFTGLRLARGVDLAAVGARYGVDVAPRYAAALVPFVDAGLLLQDGARIRLTREGMLVANEVMMVFV